MIESTTTSVFAPNNRGATPLHLALSARPAKHASADARAAGGDLEAKQESADAEGEDTAVAAIVRLLTQAADAEEGQGGAVRLCALADDDGNVALHNAVTAVPKLRSSVRVVQLLLSAGRITNDPMNKAKQTPLKMLETTERLYAKRDPEVAVRARAIRELITSSAIPDTPRSV